MLGNAECNLQSFACNRSAGQSAALSAPTVEKGISSNRRDSKNKSLLCQLQF